MLPNRYLLLPLNLIEFFFESFSPITLIIFLTFLITVPTIILTSKPEINLGALNSYQDTNTKIDKTFTNGCIDTQLYLNDDNYMKQNATFLMLARNGELDDVISTIKSIENHFNQWFNYPYVFLNDEPFTTVFMETIQNLTDSEIWFDTIDPMDWNFKNESHWNDTIRSNLISQGDRGVLYGDMLSYHKMCHFYSGKFYKNKILTNFDWYWRIEPSVNFFCDITYDPFFEMNKSNKTYAFTIMIPELYSTIPNLFRTTLSYLKLNSNITLGSLWNVFTNDYNVIDLDNYDDKNSLNRVDTSSNYLNDFINYDFEAPGKVLDKIEIDSFLREGYQYNDDGLKKIIEKAKSKKPIIEDKFNNLEYNLCHFWSNFEIAKLSIYQDPIYDNFFNYLEDQGGFWKERWGDAPVHSLGLSMILDIYDVHYFRDIGYKHDTLQHCPKNHPNQLPYKRSYSGKENNMNDREWLERSGIKYDSVYAYGTGCRCDCPTKIKRETEDNNAFCINKWYDLTHNPVKHRKPEFNLTELTKKLEKDFQKNHRPPMESLFT